MFWQLESLFRRTIVTGSLSVSDSQGRQHHFGDGSGTRIAIRLADRATERAIAFDPQLALGEAYMQGRLEVENGGIYDFLELVVRSAAQRPPPHWMGWLDGMRRWRRGLQQFNPVFRARRNAAFHYDIDGAIYELFLDADRQYSCAYFQPGAELAEAQQAKKAHIAAKLALGPGHKVLDVGSGWGGLALWLAASTGCRVKGVTLSSEQLAVAQERARKQGLQSMVEFELEDYRRVAGTFDRIVSVGMFEHVGVNHYATFFRRISRLLNPDGVALLHSIGRSDGPGFTNPFIAKYIFPGGYFPALSEVLPAIERSGLIVSDVEILRLHYAETLRAWRERFVARRAAAVQRKGEAFCRMWEFYLAGSEAAFRHQGLVVFQIQLAKRIDTLPITRDYMTETERRLQRSPGSPSAPARLAGE
ncbi:MAG: cyclopropane-fatty-acyl-phospholipid synthase family protein [Hyphomicrobiaceae bacterium]|nr:cyclopropane-fatty-acyl-phospholipid synthase family protein [Hyphomicrobiaceae bacterium]